MNVLIYELKSNLKSSLVWGISLACLAAVCMMIFPSMSNDMDLFMSVLNSYPPQMMLALGAVISLLDTLPGFYAFCYMYVVLCAGVQGLQYGISIMAKETGKKTCDFIFTKPMKRLHIINYKLLALFICIILSNLLFNVIMVPIAMQIDPNMNISSILWMNAAMFITQLLFLSLGLLIGILVRKIKSPSAAALGIISIFFLLEMYVNIDSSSILKYISFLNYFSGNQIVLHHSLDASIVLRSIIAISMCISLSLYIFHHKDIHTA